MDSAPHHSPADATRPHRGWLAARAARGGVAALAAGAMAGALFLASPAWASHQAGGAGQAITPTSYAFQALDNAADPTFNQLLGINSTGVISGYFGSGAAGHPNKGYLLGAPYGQANYTSENFPASTQTQVTGLNDLGDTSGFWVNKAGTNRGFVEWNGVFASYTDPNTPKTAGSVNQLLGINNSGVAVGFYTDAKGNSHAYEVNQATHVFTALKVPGTSVVATGINNEGNIVGFSTTGSVTSGWLLAGGHLTTYQFPGSSNTQAFGINRQNRIVGSYADSSGATHGFVLYQPEGTSTWQTIDDPQGAGSTVVNGINAAGDLVGFYTDAAGNTDGMLATPTKASLNLTPMPAGTVTFGQDASGNLTVQPNMFGLTPGSAHQVDLTEPSGLAGFGTLTASAVGQASATLDSTFTGSVPSGSRLEILNGAGSGSVNNEVIAQTAPLSGSLAGSTVSLTPVEVTPTGTSYGTPQGKATIMYNQTAQTLTVTVNASGLTPGLHAAHVHAGSCQSQGGVVYMLMDLMANSQGKIVNQTRTITGVTTPIPPTGWYLNLHQGDSNTILSGGQPTIAFRPLLCANI
jgi:hypothetical protein